jgi:hypothetical protein
MDGFYSSIHPGYYHQKPHYDLGNKMVHSSLYKKLVPFRNRYEYAPHTYTTSPHYLGSHPPSTWLYGSIDYTFNKTQIHTQAHNDWYLDRKNKPLGNLQGGLQDPLGMVPDSIGFYPHLIPRGCVKQINLFKKCVKKLGKREGAEGGKCFSDKIGIMEICPDHVLDELKEKKKMMIRAQLINNETYRRAMTVTDYNKGRSVSDLKLKSWGFGESLRPDSYWVDDRYDMKKHPHMHRYDNVNFPKQEYSDFSGGTIGQKEKKKISDHTFKNPPFKNYADKVKESKESQNFIKEQEVLRRKE